MSLESKLIEPGGLGQQRGLIGEVGESRPAPQGQGVVERADRDVRIHGEGLLRVSHERVEPGGVQLGMIEPQAVARREALDPIAADGLPEMRDIGLEDVPSLLGRLVAPDPVDQGVGGYELVRADEEMRKDRPLLRPAERDGATSRIHLERPQNAEMHPPPVHGTCRPDGQERSDLLRDVAPLRCDRQDPNGIGESLEVQLAAIQVPNALDRTGQVHQALTAEDLARPRLGA